MHLYEVSYRIDGSMCFQWHNTTVNDSKMIMHDVLGRAGIISDNYHASNQVWNGEGVAIVIAPSHEEAKRLVYEANPDKEYDPEQ